MKNGPVGRGCKIHSSNEYSGYEIKQSDGEAPVMLDLWECGELLHCLCSKVHSGSEW